jgi:presenilin-like A22 family membrane protease
MSRGTGTAVAGIWIGVGLAALGGADTSTAMVPALVVCMVLGVYEALFRGKEG